MKYKQKGGQLPKGVPPLEIKEGSSSEALTQNIKQQVADNKEQSALNAKQAGGSRVQVGGGETEVIPQAPGGDETGANKGIKQGMVGITNALAQQKYDGDVPKVGGKRRRRRRRTKRKRKHRRTRRKYRRRKTKRRKKRRKSKSKRHK